MSKKKNLIILCLIFFGCAQPEPFTPADTVNYLGKVSLGEDYSCYLDRNENMIKCWGRNSFGALGLGDMANRGDGLGEMGSNLPFVDLGTGKLGKFIVAGDEHTCAILDDDTLKCWGHNVDGQLGLGDDENRGDTSGEMGDNLPVVDLGTGRTARIVDVRKSHSCAILDNGTLKCWGKVDNGRLGLPISSENLGDDLNEMGDNLSVVDLGRFGSSIKAIGLGISHTCAILENDGVKCWGEVDDGRLGLPVSSGDQGDDSGEMGDNLPFVDLGVGRNVNALDVGGEHACVILDNNTIKCWGDNSYGELGLGDTDSRGDDSGEMGDNLASVDLGTGRIPKSITVGHSHTCVILDNNTLKCWGYNSFGQLGLGDREHRGDDPDEMGDNLPDIDLGTGRIPLFVNAGDFHTCVLLDNYSLKCWGRIQHGRLGLPVSLGDWGNESGEMGDWLPEVDLSGTGGISYAQLKAYVLDPWACLTCHGPSGTEPWGVDQIDIREEILESKVMAGNPGNSLLFTRASAVPPSPTMPPSSFTGGQGNGPVNSIGLDYITRFIDGLANP